MSTNNFDSIDDFSDDDSWLDRLSPRLQARVGQPTKQNKQSTPKRPVIEIETLADENDLLTDFDPTVTRNLDPKHFERRWLLDSLGGFYRDQMINDVLHIVKGGKEANVYCCAANLVTGYDYLAAKIYRPRMLRHLKNDAIYKEGRFVRDQSGKQLKGGRDFRAMRKKTTYGKAIDFSSWIVHEYDIHQRLYQAGVDVPEPVARADNTIMMAYIGEPHFPARTLSDTTIAAAEAAPLFEQLLANIRRMLSLNLIHGDLSAYNVLYWQGEVWIIDFPQVVDARHNPNAFALFERDVRRICQYFQPYGVAPEGSMLAAELFQRYIDATL